MSEGRGEKRIGVWRSAHGKRGHRSRLFVTPDLGQLRNKLLISFFGPGPGGPSPYIALPANSHASLAMLSPFWRFGNDDGAPTRWSIGNLTDPATVAHASKPRCMALLRSACFTLFARAPPAATAAFAARASDYMFQVIVSVVVGDFFIRLDLAYRADKHAPGIGISLGVGIT